MKKREYKTEPMNLRITPELKAFIRKKADEDYRTVASLIQKILTQWKEKNDHH